MKKIFLIFSLAIVFSSPQFAKGAALAENVSGYILLQAQENGEAWYVYPPTGERYYLGRPADAFAVMKKLSLGAKHGFIAATTIFPARLSGMILLDVERNGEAYYIYPGDRKKYYLGRPADALHVMGELGRGISNAGLSAIPAAALPKEEAASYATGIILENVPFSPQAPFGEWSDARQRDGCEEASALMAVSWARGQNPTKEESLQKIIGASDYISQKYGEYRDTSATDTLNWIIVDYFGYRNAALKKNIVKADIVDELSKGNVVIVPVDGQALGNPNYSSPGPVHHMLVVTGYDPEKKFLLPTTREQRWGEITNTMLIYSHRQSAIIRPVSTKPFRPLKKILSSSGNNCGKNFIISKTPLNGRFYYSLISMVVFVGKSQNSF